MKIGTDKDPTFGHWFAGFAAGEGCFQIVGSGGRGKSSFCCTFEIGLRADDKAVLCMIQQELGLGTVRTFPNIRGSSPTTYFRVVKKADCLALREFFQDHPLRAKKAFDFEIWSEALDYWVSHERGTSWENIIRLRDQLMSSRKYRS